MMLNNFSLDVGSGNIKIHSLNAKEAEFDVGSGNIEINSIVVNGANIDVSSGNVEMRHFIGRLNADVSSGNLSIQVDELIDDINMEVSSGNIGLDLPDDSNFTLVGEISSGRITSKLPLENEEKSKHRLRGTHGSGTYKIDLDVSSGSININ